ncbi:MAG: tetratricopeptide repeat protein [Gammaproteobacteria bacterium]
MNAIATDEENVMMIKVWWQKNRKWLVTVIVLAAVGFGAYKYYTGKQNSTAEAASLLFTEFFGAHEQGDPELTASLAKQIHENYPTTPYANTVALMLAHDAVDKNDLKAAAEQLSWIVDKGPAFGKEIARARLAQVKIAEQDPEAALKLVSDVNAGEYQPLIEEVKGDALFALKRYKDARTAYTSALDGYTKLGLEAHLLQFKLDALPL